MSVVTQYYCKDCHHNASEVSNLKSHAASISSRIFSHAYVSGKTFTAYPIIAALVVTACTATIIATAILFGTGFILPACAVLVLSINIGVLGAILFKTGRRVIDSQEYKKAHSFDEMIKHIKPNQKICLVIEATHDHNGAFNSKGPKKWEKKYPIVHIKVSNFKEVEEAIEKVSAIGKVQILWFAAHGHVNRMRFGKKKEEILSVNNLNLISRSLNKIEKDATIICNSCQTGKLINNDPNTLNFAKKLSELAPHQTVVAPSISISRQHVYLKSGKKLKIGMQTGMMFGPNFIGKHFRKNVMQIYKSGQLQPESKFVQIN